MKSLFKTLIIVIAFAAPPGFAAEDYPVRPIRFIVPMPPGGALDTAARILGTNLTEILGHDREVIGGQGRLKIIKDKTRIDTWTEDIG